jgi:hypothetical protein
MCRPLKKTGPTAEPRIYVLVERMVEGQHLRSMRQLDLQAWRRGLPAQMFDSEINAMMREVYYS